MTKYNVLDYSYLFDQWPIGGQPNTTGTTHFTEVPLVHDNEIGNGFEALWYPAGSEFAGMNEDFYALARLMSMTSLLEISIQADISLGRIWTAFAHDLDPNEHGIERHNGHIIPRWTPYAGSSSEALDGYGVNLRLLSTLLGLVELEPDNWRAEAIHYLNRNSSPLFGN